MSTNIVRNDLLANLEDKEYRELFVAEHINRTVSFQIRATREAQDMKQAELGEKVGMAQGRISLLEDANYGSLTINTLKRIANALDVALIVRFVPFTQLTTWVAGEAQIIPGLSSEALAVPEFKVDVALVRSRAEETLRPPRLPKNFADMMDSGAQRFPTPPALTNDATIRPQPTPPMMIQAMGSAR